MERRRPAERPGSGEAGPRPQEVQIRRLASASDFAACVALQHEIWGATFQEVVPPSILRIVPEVGGIADGAFDAEGRLLGFVFGLAGVRGGETVLWSDMLAVQEEARDLGIGRRLKLHQRDHARALGARRILWTYDPLVARNAHLNVNRLGVDVESYVPDFYATTGSDLHDALGTDRLVVAWDVTRTETARSAEAAREAGAGAPVVNDLESSALDRLAREGPDRVRIAVPEDVHAGADGPRWRAPTRRAFETLLARGWSVSGFYADPAAHRGYYVLGREARRP